MYGGRSLPYKNVRFGYSIYLPMKQQKSTFNSYNLFHDVTLIQNMANVLLIAQILRLHHQDERARIHQDEQEYASEVGKKPVLSGQPS